MLARLIGREGTIEPVFPARACAEQRVVERGIASYPECPSRARFGWEQRAINLPAAVMHAVWPNPWVQPQRLALPAVDRPHDGRWNPVAWIVVGVVGHVLVAVAVGALWLGLGALRKAAPPTLVPRLWRRRWWATSGAMVILAYASGRCSDAGVSRRSASTGLPRLQPLTTGPRFHWFGYYDKLQFDPTDRYVLGMAVDFEKREILPTDVIEIGMVDLRDDNRWIALGHSRAWNWQQGCMLQWIPGSEDEIVWNDREARGEDSRLIARILDVGSGEERTLPHPIYTIAPDGETALAVDFERVFRHRPDYGYAPVYARGRARQPNIGATSDAGVHAIDMRSGTASHIVSLRDIGTRADAEHFIEMLQINPSGTRFLLFERWLADRRMWSRVFTANLDGSDLFLLVDTGIHSHVAWLDDRRVVIHSAKHGGYAIHEDRTGDVSMLLALPQDGHQSFFEHGTWMVSDTYPDAGRVQHPYLFHLPTEQVFSLAHLFSPPEYEGIHRCDTHPRVSRSGRQIVIDSAHQGGRQMYLLDIGAILDSEAHR